MAVPVREQRALAMRSGNRCGFPGCGLELAVQAPDGEMVVLGEMAHIVGESPGGPRGESPMTAAERNAAENLILLCNRHHQLIDDTPGVYTVEKLLQIKADHEAGVQRGLESRLGPERIAVAPMRTDTVYSTMLRVERMPQYVYGAPCSELTDRNIRAVTSRGQMAPFIVRGGMLWAFQDLRSPNSPFVAHVDRSAAETHHGSEWWDDPDRMRWYQQLLNRSLNKLTGRRGLRLDAKHHRYYFEPLEPGQPRHQIYRPLNADKATRAVVWQPTMRKSGEPRDYWLHRAVSLRFDRVSAESWTMSIRPELRITKDGIHDVPSETVGRKVTRKKSRLFNHDLLAEVQFWRDVLSDSSPRIVFDFGPPEQRLVVSTTMVSADVTWPGIPDEHAKPFGNIDYVDDLFSWGEAEADYAEDGDDVVDLGEPEDSVSQ